jgi:hypothetical protein
MTAALQEANLLFDLLRTLDGSQLSTLAPTFLTKAETLIAAPWAMSAIPDFIYPETTGERPADLEDRLNFQRALGRLAVRDPEVYYHARRILNSSPSAVGECKLFVELVSNFKDFQWSSGC